MATYLNNLQDDNNIPLADDDPQGILYVSAVSVCVL